MIKADVTVIGNVVQPPQVKQNPRGYFYTAVVRSSVPQKEGGTQDILISLSAPQAASAGLEQLQAGQGVSLKGTLYFRKNGDQVYYNMNVAQCVPVVQGTADSLTGDLTMIGFLGTRAPEVRNGKGGKPFMNFSAYSVDGEGDERAFTWVRFIRFSGDVEPFLVPKALVLASGAMELQFYQGKLSISCRLAGVQPYVKKAPDEAPF